MRKLYVACTRARDKLILTAALKPEQEPAKNSFLNWLMQTDIKTIYAETDTPVCPFPQKITAEPPSPADESQELIAATKRVYSREPLTKIPRRVTATQVGVQSAGFSIQDENQDEPTVFPRSASFMKNKKLTGKKRGDAYHKMMELLDFKAGNFKQQMQNHKSRFTEEEFAAIEHEKIEAFFASPLGKRASASAKICKEFKLCTEINLSELGCPAEYDVLFEGEKPFVQGIADMFFYEDENIILVDYKTNRNISSENLIRQYRKQLEIYARAIGEMTGSKVSEKWIYSFELGGIIA
jgi:ATP-dependent helicase/nuclease subunit A